MFECAAIGRHVASIILFRFAEGQRSDHVTTLQSGVPTTAVPVCPCCDSGERRLRVQVREREYDNTTDDTFSFHECLACTAWYLDPRPADASLDIIYPPNYYARVGTGGPGSGLGEKLQRRLFAARLAPTSRHTELGPRTRWFEIGCGQGEFLDRLRRFFGVVEILGIDMSPSSVEICRSRELRAEAVRFEDYDVSEEGAFDVVHSSHVIEHMASPVAYMEKVHRLLRPGGLCVFDTPNTDSWEVARLGPYWGGLHAPRHWVLLNPTSARKLGERTGFEYLDTQFFTSSFFWIWSWHHLLERVAGRRIADACFPSDHRINASGLPGILRNGLATAFESATLRIAKRSGNMTSVLRKRAGAEKGAGAGPA